MSVDVNHAEPPKPPLWWKDAAYCGAIPPPQLARGQSPTRLITPALTVISEQIAGSIRRQCYQRLWSPAARTRRYHRQRVREWFQRLLSKQVDCQSSVHATPARLHRCPICHYLV